MTATDGRLRIRELARRTGASPAALRAWEQRYGIIAPQRSLAKRCLGLDAMSVRLLDDEVRAAPLAER